jgi:hypothetical protein
MAAGVGGPAALAGRPHPVIRFSPLMAVEKQMGLVELTQEACVPSETCEGGGGRGRSEGRRHATVCFVPSQPSP